MFKKLLFAAALSLLSMGSAFAACTNPLPILNGSAGSVNMSVSQNTADAGCMYNVTPNQGGAPLSATNGWWTNILQGNAVISATNPLFMAPSTSSVWPVSVASTVQTVGPTAVGSANANPPVVIGGTVTGAAGQNVEGLAIKPASTAAAATDLSAVTNESPNSQLSVDMHTTATNSALPLPAQSTDVLIGDVRQIDANSNVALVDPCQSGAKTYTPINIVTAANTKIVAGTASKKTYICGLFLYPGATDNIAIIEGSGTNCGTSPIGLIGGNTAATGIIATAQAGFVLPTTGYAHAASTVNANDFCLITSAAVQLSGVAVTVAR